MEGEECKEGDSFCFRHNPNSTASTSVSWAALPITSAYRVHQRAAFCPSFWLPQLASTTSSRIVEIAACQRGTQPQQTFPKVALAAVLYLFQNRLPFVRRTPAFSSYLRSLSARASAPTYHTISSLSSCEQENSSLLFSVRYLVYQLATCQLATELQYSAHLPCSSVFLSLYHNAALPLFGSPTMPHRLEIQQHQLLCSSRSKEPKKKNITASTAPEHARSTPPKEI